MRTLTFFVALLLLFAGCSPKKTIELDFIPPLKEVVVEADELRIDPTKNQVVHFENGTSIDVPENAFVDQEGNVITEPVTLALSTYNNPAEVLASGIPMAYHDGENMQDFESAGMFQIKGYAEGKEVMIQDGKELGVSYPSATAGDYDFFYLEENEADGVKKAAWKQLNDTDKEETENMATPVGLGEYQLQFDTASYPELAELERIKWRVASEHGNPLDEANGWVLDEKWTSVDITQPKYGFGRLLIKDDFPRHSSPIFMADHTRIVILGKTGVNIWNTSGTLIKHIEHSDRFGRASSISDKHLLVHFEDGDGIFDSNGELVGKLEEGSKHVVIPSEKRIVFRKRAEPYTILVYDFDGNKVTELALGQEVGKNWNDPVIVSDHFVTPENELITNSKMGMVCYDLNGIEKWHKEGSYRSVQYMAPHRLLIGKMDGTLTVWDWHTNEQTSSKRSDFSMLSYEDNGLVYRSYSRVLPDMRTVVIRKTYEGDHILWDYKTGLTSKTEGDIIHFQTDSNKISQVLTTNWKANKCQLIELPEQKVVLDITSHAEPKSEVSNFSIVYSQDSRYFLLSAGDHSALYNYNGVMLQNFKDFDSSIIETYFTEQQQINSINSRGTLTTWDLLGNRIRSKQLEYSNYDYVHSAKSVSPNSFPKNGFTALKKRTSGYNYFNGLGQLYTSGFFLRSMLDSTSVFVYRTTGIQLRELFELHQQAYQLRLSKGTKTFATYVFLSPEDKVKVDRYNTIKTRRFNTEKDRQEKEAAVVRSFAIKNFGIYNWDRFYKDESRVRIAANFDFGLPTDFNSITVFLITEANGTSVIKFYDGNWDKFSIDPKANNQLLAVLPDNKVAHLSHQDLQKLNWEAIKKSGKHTFQMTVSEKPIASLLDLNAVLN